MLRHSIYIGILLLISYTLIGQTVFQPKPVEYNLKGIVYSTESSVEMRPHFQGFSLAFKKGKINNYYQTSYRSFEIGYMRDGREKRQTLLRERIGLDLREPFIYGKRSQFFNLRMTYGQKTFLSEKTKRKGVAMALIYEGGASLGLIKPYYLKVIRRDNSGEEPTIETIRYSEESEAEFLDFDNIYGGTNFWKGFTALTPTIGLHGKVGMHWSLGAFEDKVRALEVGLMMDVYPRKIPLMVERDDVTNSFFLAKLYASFQFGKRKL